MRRSFLNYQRNIWGIVLAGGEGNRLKKFVKKLYGYARPKQYCTFIGTRSMIRHTLDRALMLIPQEHLLTVITKHQYKFAVEEIGELLLPSLTVNQPYARDTSAGILLPMLKINHMDPDSIVSIFPSDHFIKEENRFMDFVNEANEFVMANPDSIVMLGIRPDRIENGYGWIEIGSGILQNGDKSIYRVCGFCEKPDSGKAEILWRNGCLWNTFVLVGRSTTFIKHIQACIPEVFDAFIPIRSALGTSKEETIIESTFQHLPSINFSKFVLERIPENLHVIEISNVHWSDWGEEERIQNDIDKYSLCLRDYAFAS